MSKSRDRMQATKSAHEKEIGYVTQGLFEQMGGGKLQPGEREHVREFEKARDRSEGEDVFGDARTDSWGKRPITAAPNR